MLSFLSVFKNMLLTRFNTIKTITLAITIDMISLERCYETDQFLTLSLEHIFGTIPIALTKQNNNTIVCVVIIMAIIISFIVIVIVIVVLVIIMVIIIIV